MYNDISHFTVAGSQLFVENMMDSLREVVDMPPHDPAVNEGLGREAQ